MVIVEKGYYSTSGNPIPQSSNPIFNRVPTDQLGIILNFHQLIGKTHIEGHNPINVLKTMLEDKCAIGTIHSLDGDGGMTKPFDELGTFLHGETLNIVNRPDVWIKVKANLLRGMMLTSMGSKDTFDILHQSFQSGDAIVLLEVDIGK
jgi:hypothetical protein